MSIDKEYSSNILKRMRYCDSNYDRITLISGKDKQRFPIQRLLLNAASKYFVALLGANKEYILDDIDGETIEMTVDFCYTGNISLNEENVDKLLAIAASIQIDLLEEKCRQFLVDKLNVNNAVDTLTIADKYSFAKLRRRALKLICESFELVSSEKLQQINHRLLRELLQCDNLNAPEELIFNRLFEWFEASKTHRNEHMPELLKLIQLQRIAPQFLTSTLEAAYNSCNCSEIIYTEYRRRVNSRGSNVEKRRLRPIWGLFTRPKGFDSATYSAVEISKYNIASKRHEDIGEITLGKRTLFGVILHNEKIYILGGHRSGHWLNSFSSYDMITHEEEILPGSNVSRGSFAAILLGKYIYIFGGRNESGALKKCERFDIDNNTWEAVKPTKVARFNATATVFNDYICVAGGEYKDVDGEIKSVELYNPNSYRWLQLADMNQYRAEFGLFELNGFLYAMGFHDGIEKYDPWIDCWTEIGSFVGGELVTKAMKIDGRIYAVMRNGNLGRIHIDENNNFSFERLSESKHKSELLGMHFLF